MSKLLGICIGRRLVCRLCPKLGWSGGVFAVERVWLFLQGENERGNGTPGIARGGGARLGCWRPHISMADPAAALHNYSCCLASLAKSTQEVEQEVVPQDTAICNRCYLLCITRGESPAIQSQILRAFCLQYLVLSIYSIDRFILIHTVLCY